MGTRIMFIMVFGIVLLLGSVVALSSLSSHSYIEKTKDGFIVWEGVEYYKTDLEKEKVKLEKDKEIILDGTYEECVENCPTFCKPMKEYNDCLATCPSQCKQQEELFLQSIDYKINELNSILKVK